MNQKELSDFLRSLAHDLQNQIGAVDLNLQILPTLVDMDQPALQEMKPFLSRASVSASEMIETLTDIQRFAYNIAGSTEHALSQLDLPTLLRDSLLILSPTAQARELTVSVGVCDEGTTLGEREGVLRAIRLLAAEAMRSSFPGTSFMLNSSKSEDGQVSITLHSSQDGLFEAHRPTLALYLAKEALKPSRIELQFFTGSSRSAVRLLFPPANI